MIYQIRVTLPGIKGFYRLYKVNAANSLYSLHKRMQSDLEFPVDQPILFKATDFEGTVVARYALIDLGYGTVDDVTMDMALKAGADSFEYFYDTKNKKKVILTVEGCLDDNSVLVPTLLNDVKGPVPAEFDAGYVAFEDLPQEKRRLPGEDPEADLEEEDEEDEEEEKDDDTEEIYSEDE